MAISSYQKDGKTYYKVYVNLRSQKLPHIRRQKKSIDIETERQAQQIEKRMYVELMEELAKIENKGFSWEEIVGKWELAMRHEGSRYALTTIQDNVAQMHNWTTPWLKKQASELCRADGRDVLKNLIDSGRSKGFVKHVKSTINIIFQWGIEHRLIQGVHESPVKGLNLDSRKEEKIPEILTIEEIKRLLDAAKKMEHEWYPVWAVALLTGMRNGEMFALRWTDVDLQNRKISVSRSYNTRMRADKCTKSGKWRTIPISDQLMGILVDLRNNAGNREHVFPRLQSWAEGQQANILRRFCIGIGLRSIRFHALRACFATQLLSNDVAPAKVMKVCGWQDLKTMQHYVRLAGVDERGVTDSLNLIPSDEECMDKVVHLLDFKNGKN